MKAHLLACLMLAPAAHAQTVECPRFYPWEDAPLAEVPPHHQGQGFVAKARLTGGGMYAGELGGKGELQGARTKIKDGWNVDFGFAAGDARWLVCSYGDNITWWERLITNATSCRLAIREGIHDPMSVAVACSAPPKRRN